MNLHIVTIGIRDYIHETMKSLMDSGFEGSINLFVGSSEEDYLDRYRPLSQVTIIPWDAVHKNRRLNCVQNHARALGYGDEEGPVLVCEDDVFFKPDWRQKLEEAVRKIPDIDYALDIKKTSNQKGGFPELWNGSHMVGIQGVYYSTKKVRKKIAEYMNSPSLFSACADLIVGRIVMENFNLWVVRDNLIEHIGLTSTFTGN